MSQILHLANYPERNLSERTFVTVDSVANASSVTVDSSQGYAINDYIYVGDVDGEKSDLVKITGISGNVISSTDTFKFAHTAGQIVYKLNGNQIKIYRAPNVDGNVPDDTNFASIATIDIDPDQMQTDYTDATGGSSYWYKSTFYNSTNTNETALSDSSAIRGGGGTAEYPEYCSNEDVRNEAGLQNNTHITDDRIDEKRTAAQAFIDASLNGKYIVPFTAPINPLIAEITRKLAAGYLLTDDYGPVQTLDTRQGQQKIDYVTNKDGTGVLDKLVAKDLTLTSVIGNDESVVDSGVFSAWPDETTASADIENHGGDYMFRVKDRY
jgi:hypothetical protein